MEPRGKTLWEMLVERVRGGGASPDANPLGGRVGSPVMIDEPDLKELNFFVREIREYRREIEGRLYPFTDYTLLARPLGGEDVQVRLRLSPPDERDHAAGAEHQVLLLRLYDDLPYDEGLHGVVTDTTGKFEVVEDDEVTEEYWRIHDVTDSYLADVTIRRDAGGQGAGDEEVERTRIEYWDYWREMPDEAGQPVRQYLFVEMDAETGWFQIWQGHESDARRIYVL